MTMPPAFFTSAWARWIGLAAGSILLAAAVAAVSMHRGAIEQALAALAHPSPLHVAVLLTAMLGNIVATGIVLSALTSRYGRVGLVEMQALVAGTALVNYLPLRPGLFGRVAYHRAVNRIAVADSVKVLVQALVISGAVVAYLLAAVILASDDVAPALLASIAPIPLLLGATIVPAARVWAIAALARLIDVLLWAVRYWAAFELIGSPIDAGEAAIFACISVVTTLVPFVSNGLGLREWAIGLAAGTITSGQLELGITAELVNRAAEVAIVLITGGISLLYLSARRRMTADK